MKEAVVISGQLPFLLAVALCAGALLMLGALRLAKLRKRRVEESCMSRMSVAYSKNVVTLSLQELLDHLSKKPCKKRYIMLCGAQGSGKTTIAEELAKRGFVFLSMDKMVEDEPILATMLQRLHAQFFGAFEAALARGDNIVDDNMNVARSERAAALKMVRAAGYSDIVLVHLNVPLETCLERNAGRRSAVPEWILRRCWESLAGAERPSPAEAPLIRVAPLDNEMRQCTMYLMPG